LFALNLKCDQETAKRRLLDKRKREDDNEVTIKKKLDEYAHNEQKVI
jgi:adenylate kinase family enzyme